VKLDAEQISVLQEVRHIIDNEIATGLNRRNYICLTIEDEIQRRCKKEQNQFWNYVLFWRQYEIRSKWLYHERSLCNAVRAGIGHRHTLSRWLEFTMFCHGVNMPYTNRDNMGLYRMARLAWLDRSIETGELK
jgi:hypothetical protein